MTGSWDSVVAGEIGTGSTVLVTIMPGVQVEGVVDALWIPAAQLSAFPGEVRLRVRVPDEHGSWWVGPHILVERAT